MANYNREPGRGQGRSNQKTNEWTGVGTVHPRSGNDDDEIRFFPFQRGGGAIHITVECTEPSMVTDENGNQVPKTDEKGNEVMRRCYVPVNIMTNRLITQQQLMGIQPGMRVRVVGRLQSETYTSKKNDQKVTTLVVNAFVLEVLSQAPSAIPPQGAVQNGAQYGPYPPQAGYPAPQPQYMPPRYDGPQYQQGAAQPPYYPPQYPPQEGYPQYPPQAGYPPVQQPQAPQYPPRYAQQAPAQGSRQAAPAQPASIEDMPDFGV